jgi:hypothetical protein
VRPLAWTLLAAGVGLLSAGAFSSLLHLDRPVFALAHAVVVAGFVAAYVRSTGIDPGQQLRRHWLSGTVGGVVFGLILVRGVMAQPESHTPRGGELVVALVRLGAVYGVADALLLSVVPVLSIYGSRGRELQRGFMHRLGWGIAALGGSLFVAAVYHLGFAEYRGLSLAQPLIGNAIVTASYLLTGSPLAPIIAHVLMHAAAVLHGPATTYQLPPHY